MQVASEPQSVLQQRLLVVDDDVSSLAFMKALLQLEKFQVETAVNYETALDKTTQFPFDGFILDINMPGIDGLGLCEVLKQQFPSTPVIFCSAVAYPEQIRGILNRCGDAYIVKPVDPAELLTTLRSHLPTA